LAGVVEELWRWGTILVECVLMVRYCRRRVVRETRVCCRFEVTRLIDYRSDNLGRANLRSRFKGRHTRTQDADPDFGLKGRRTNKANVSEPSRGDSLMRIDEDIIDLGRIRRSTFSIITSLVAHRRSRPPSLSYFDLVDAPRICFRSTWSPEAYS
jgi:hypothetical protein